MMKFPKEETLIITEINKLYEVNKYSSIVKMYDKIVDNIEVIASIDEKCITKVIESLFYSKLFDKIIAFVDGIRNKGFESFNWYFYAFASLLGNEDFYYARSIIKKSQILNDATIQSYLSEDGANYSNILGMNEELLNTAGPCLIMINFLNELIGETLTTFVDKKYVLMRYFDLLNILVEYGASIDLLDMLDNTIKICFDLENLG